jgi:phosphate transport system substrate-binding protein
MAVPTPKLSALTKKHSTLLHSFIVSCGCIFLLAAQAVSAEVSIAGSDTVEPILSAAVDQFKRSKPTANVKLESLGTGTGFAALCKGEADIAMASRAITAKEKTVCAGNKRDYIELPIAWDAVVLVSHPGNTWLRELSIGEVRSLWELASNNKVMQWNQVRANFPATKIALGGLDLKSGTADFFSAALTGAPKMIRADFKDFSDHSKVVQYVAATPGAIGFVSLVVYLDQPDKVALVAIDEGKGAVIPSVNAVISDQYAKLSRLLFIYVSKQAYEAKPEVSDFANFLIDGASRFVSYAHGVPLTAASYTAAKNRLRNKEVGTIFGGR